MNNPLTPVHVEKSLNPGIAWAEGKNFLVPDTIFETFLSPYSDTAGNLTLPIHLDAPQGSQGAHLLRLRAAFTPKKPLFASLPISYQQARPEFRSALASLWGKHLRHRQDLWAAFPRWPLDLSADFVADALGEKTYAFDQGSTPVILSHDLDSAEGLKNLILFFLKIEENVGARSTNFIVPCGWPIDHGLLKEVHERGCEIGIHGYDHSNRTPFCSDAKRKHRLQAAQGLIERYQMIGYRAPSLFRTSELLRDLGSYYRYDSSIPTSGGLFPAANNGCASARPFQIGNLMELPISLPRDGSLRFLGHSPRQILKLWIQCAEEIADSGGVVVLLTHCEERFSGNTEMLEIYAEFLQFLSNSKRFYWSSPAEVLQKTLNPV